MDKQTAKENLVKLVDRFKSEFESGKTNAYTEEDTKASFITPLLTNVLGWEVHNRDEVVMEYSISRGRIDYGIKVGNDFKFFVEAKQISADLEDDKAAKQAIAYGYNSKVPFVILTDFEGLKALS